jgi:hypothetical protein
MNDKNYNLIIDYYTLRLHKAQEAASRLEAEKLKLNAALRELGIEYNKIKQINKELSDTVSAINFSWDKQSDLIVENNRLTKEIEKMRKSNE